MSFLSRTAVIAVMVGTALAAARLAQAREFDAPTLLVQHRFFTTKMYNDYLLLLPDGTVYANLPKEGMKGITAAKLAAESKERPWDIGKWTRAGDGIQTTFTRPVYDSQIQATRNKVEVTNYQKTPNGGWSLDGKQSNYNTYAPVIPLDAARLLGPWELDEKLFVAGTPTGAAPMVTAIQERNYTFYADGKFIGSSSQIVASTTTLRGLDHQPRFRVGTYQKSPDNVQAGTYRLDAENLAIALTEVDGTRRTITAFILPNWGDAQKNPTVVIDGRRMNHPKADAGAEPAKAADAPQPAPKAPVVAGNKFGHFRFELPKGWSQAEEDGSLTLRPEGGAEKKVGIILFGSALHKGDQPLASFEKWFDETVTWLQEGRTVVQTTNAADKEGRYPMRVQGSVVTRPDGTKQARLYVGLKRDRNAELIVLFAPDEAALGAMMAPLDGWLGGITLEND